MPFLISMMVPVTELLLCMVPRHCVDTPLVEEYSCLITGYLAWWSLGPSRHEQHRGVAVLLGGGLGRGFQGHP